MNTLDIRQLHLIHKLLEVNHYISSSLFVFFIFLLLSGYDDLEMSNYELFGPLANNLAIVLVYLVLIEVMITLLCMRKNSYVGVMILGFFYILLIGSLEFYATMNQIPMTSVLRSMLLYVGLSHIGFGIFSQLEKR